MQRKLVQQGTSTLMISLPRNWIKANNLQKGSNLEIEESNGNVIISADKIQRKKMVEFAFQNESESVIRVIITNAYRVGVDEIRLTFTTNKQYDQIINTVKTKLIGFQVTHKEKKTCIIENVAEPASEQYEVLLSKYFQSIKYLISIAQNKLSREVDEDVEELEERIQVYQNYCLRCASLQRSAQIDFFLLFLYQVQHGQRDVYLALKENIMQKDSTVLQKIEDAYGFLYSAYTTKNISMISKIHEIASSNTSLTSSYHLRSALRNFYLASSPLSGLIMLQNKSN